MPPRSLGICALGLSAATLSEEDVVLDFCNRIRTRSQKKDLRGEGDPQRAAVHLHKEGRKSYNGERERF